jgi:hypothetical protein
MLVGKRIDRSGGLYLDFGSHIAIFGHVPCLNKLRMEKVRERVDYKCQMGEDWGKAGRYTGQSVGGIVCVHSNT